jgi:predicted double-glycine peptidase
MPVIIGLVISVCLFAGFHEPLRVPDDQLYLNLGTIGGPVLIDQRVTPLSAFLDKNIIKQTHDFSCGSAALCTLLNYYLGENFTESQVIHGLMENSDKNKIAQRRAFSLLDMKKFVNLLGYNGAGYKAELQDLIELESPCIIPIEFLGYRHFTVLKGVYDNHIFLADPYRGNTSYTLSTFKKMWYENVIFIVHPEGAPELKALKLTNDDLRYINEDTLQDLLFENNFDIAYPEAHKREFFFSLPDEYNKYNPD